VAAATIRDGGAARVLATPDFVAAQRALRADGSVQFDLVRPTPPTRTPAWLRVLAEWIDGGARAIGRALARLGAWLPDWPYAKMLLWGVVGALLLAIAWAVVERLRYGAWRWPRWRRRAIAAPALDEETAPLFDAAPVRAWLREADALAAAGRYAEAAHLLLFRSVEDLARRRPGLVQPALTARELAAAPVLPPRARDRFAAIARLVERSLFGGAAVDRADWEVARADYADLALPAAWRA
jgi:hypothetical protein